MAPINRTHRSTTTAIKSKPAPLYHPSFKNRITTGNLEDDIAKVKDVDWIMEVVVERLDIKKQVFEKLEAYRTPGTLITSNTINLSNHLKKTRNLRRTLIVE